MIWNSQRLTEWCAMKKYRRTASGSNDTPLSPQDFTEYEAWLADGVARGLWRGEP
jgi:hypothetical protein